MSRWIGYASASVKTSARVYSEVKLWHNRLKAVEIPVHLDIFADMHCGAHLKKVYATWNLQKQLL
jgi:hypothetical protein